MTSPTPEPCTDERLSELLVCALSSHSGWLTIGAGELVWLVTEARVAAGLGAELEAARAETEAALAVVADQRERLAKLRRERDHWFARYCDGMSS